MSVMQLVVPTSGTIIRVARSNGVHGRLCVRPDDAFRYLSGSVRSLDARQTVYESVVEPLIIHKAGGSATERRNRVLEAWTSHTSSASAPRGSIPISFREANVSGCHRVSNCPRTELIVADEPCRCSMCRRARHLRLDGDLRDRLACRTCSSPTTLRWRGWLPTVLRWSIWDALSRSERARSWLRRPPSLHQGALSCLRWRRPHRRDRPVSGEIIEVFRARRRRRPRSPGCHFHPRVLATPNSVSPKYAALTTPYSISPIKAM